MVRKMKTNVIYNKDCRHMNELDDDSIDLVVTSPPYNVQKDYGENHDDGITVEEYGQFTSDWIKECRRVLVLGGRICINVANTGRKPYVFLNNLVTRKRHSCFKRSGTR